MARTPRVPLLALGRNAITPARRSALPCVGRFEEPGTGDGFDALRLQASVLLLDAHAQQALELAHPEGDRSELSLFRRCGRCRGLARGRGLVRHSVWISVSGQE